MKKITLVTVLSLCAAGAYAQGLLLFSDFSGGDNSQIYSPVASPQLTTGPLAGETVGNTSAQSPVGSQSYSSTPIGGSTGGQGSYANGNNFSVQVYWYQPAANIPASRLTAGSTFLPAYYTTLLTTEPGGDGVHGNGNPAPAYVGTLATSSSPGAGYFVSGPQSQAGGLYGDTQTQSDAINRAVNDNTALIAVACWFNAGNTVTSYAAAQAGGFAYGISLPAFENSLGESQTDYADMGGSGTPPLPEGLTVTSWSLVNGSIIGVPEPSTIALGVMGVCAFLARRRMK